jgi:hypothetical protein
VDPYIDYEEVSVYGRYFYRQAESLIGASELVDVEMLRRLVLARVEGVETELLGVGGPRSVERLGRGSVGETTEEMRDNLRRFYFHLQSLPVRSGVDIAAFFAGGKLGRISQHKPEDLLAQGDAVLRGFTLPASSALPEATRWQTDISASRQALDQAIHGKLSATNSASAGTSSLTQARTRFLVVYNKVAKRLIRGLLAELGREHELRRYFRDLQVNEEREIVGDVPDALAGNDKDDVAA